MDCKQVENILPAYAEKKLQEALIPGVEEHLGQCSLCSRKAVMLQEMFDLIKREKGAQPNPFLSTRIVEQLKARKTPVRFYWRPALAGAFLGIALLAGIFAGLNAEKFTRPGQTEISSDIVLLNDMADEKIEWLLMNNK